MGTWTHTVKVDGQDVNVVGMITVRAEENTASTAQFSYNAPLDAPFDPANVRGKSVTVDHGATRIFTGTVDSAVPNSEGLITVQASDGLLAYFDALDEAGILAAIPGGRYHEALFGQRTSGWAQAQSVLETVTDEAHFTPNGTLQISSWLDPVSRSINDAVYLSEGSDFADTRNQVNRVEITLKYRFTRAKQRAAALTWTHPQFSSLGDWLTTPTTLPSRDMIQAAADGTGWNVINGIDYVTLPNNIGAWQPEPKQQEIDVIKADLSLFHRFTQPVEETYLLNVQAGAASTPLHKRDIAYDSPFDTASWEGNRLAYDPSWPFDTLGDRYYDGVDRADLDSLMECAIAWAGHRIAASKRSNYVQFAVVADPQLTLNDVVDIDTAWLSARGKVYALEHRLDTGQGGVDLTVVTLACSDDAGNAGGGGTPPSPPDTSPDWTIGTIPGMSASRFGSIGTALPDDPDWVGYVGNYDPPLGGTGDQIYKGRFRIGAGEIEQQSLDPVEATQTAAEYAAATPGGRIIVKPNPNIP